MEVEVLLVEFVDVFVRSFVRLVDDLGRISIVSYEINISRIRFIFYYFRCLFLS